MDLGIPAPRGKKRWGFMSLHNLLTNPVYTGKVYAGRLRSIPTRKRMSPLLPVGRHPHSQMCNPPEEWILVGQVPAIVSEEQFELVRLKLSQNQSFARRNNKSYQYLLRTLVSCGECGNSCLGCARGKRTYYACRAKGRAIISGIEHKCRSRYLPAGQLDELVWQDLCEVVEKPELIKTALQRAQGGGWLPQEIQARKENLRKGRASLTNQLERLTSAYLTGVIELEEYKRRREELEQRQSGLEQFSRQLEASVEKQAELAGIAKSIEEFCGRVKGGLAGQILSRSGGWWNY
jgi:site-specific DNA recombinase